MFEDVFQKGKVDGFDEGMQPLLKLMSREILKQKKRLGGDFAVAHAVVSRYAISSKIPGKIHKKSFL